MEKAGGAERITRAIRTRGIGGVSQGKIVSVKAKHGGDVTKVSEVVSGRGDAVRVITINHK